MIQSVKAQLTLLYSFILLVILSSFSIFMYTEFSRALYGDADRSLSQEVNQLEKSLKPYIHNWVSTPKEIRKEEILPGAVPLVNPQGLRDAVLKWEASNRQVARSTRIIRIIHLNNEVMTGNLKGWEQEIIFPDYERDSTLMETGESFQTIHFQRKPIRLYYRMIKSGEVPLLIIQSGISIQIVKDTLSRLAFIIIFLVPLAAGAAGIAGWFLARRSFRPVDFMIKEARQISAAYLNRRLPRTERGDELDRLAETLNEMIDRIESSTRAIQDFSSDISHELKTPLAIIRGEIDLALRRERSADELRSTIQTIEGEVHELIRLVDDLMLLVRSDAKQLRLEKSPISLVEVMQTTMHRFQESAAANGVEIRLDADEDCVVYADLFYLKRLFANLVDNAVKFTKQGGSVTLTLQKMTQPPAAVISVQDTGIGIEAELQEKVFSRFYRTDRTRSYEGSGLGLNIAKAICDAHQAKISITSHLNVGTTVTVRFPLS